MDRKQKILDLIEDLVMDLMSYDRKEDEEMDEDSIFDAVDKDITIEEMTTQFHYKLHCYVYDTTSA